MSMDRAQDSFVSRRSMLSASIVTLAGTAFAAPAVPANEDLDPALLAAVAACREAEAVAEAAEGEAADAALKRLQQSLEILIETPTYSPRGVALKVSALVGARLAYLEGEMRNREYGYDERLAYSIVRDLHMMGATAQ